MSDETIDGRLERDDFGGPTLILRADDGQRFQLKGDVPRRWVGQRVRVHGSPAEAQFGFAMVGPIIDVRRVEALD